MVTTREAATVMLVRYAPQLEVFMLRRHLAVEFMAAHRSVGGRTSEAAERAQAIRAIQNIYRRGGNPQKEIQDAINNGLLRRSEVPRLRKQAKFSFLQIVLANRDMTPGEALKIYDVATPEERASIKTMVRKKVMSARTKGYEWNPKTRSLAAKYFGIRPVSPRPAAPPAFQDLAAPSALQ